MTVSELTADSFAETTAKKTLVIVDFFADWCGPCKRLTPIMEELASEGYEVYKVNVDENPEITSQFSIMSIPTVLFFKEGKVVDKFVGLLSKQDIIDKIEKKN